MASKVIKTGARFVRTAPDKIRNLAGLVKGKNITKALEQVMFSGKYAAIPLSLVLKQARAQIKDQNLVEDNFKVSEMRVDEGPKLKRRRIRHQGRATAILKRMSHITIILTEKIVEIKENKPKLVKKVDQIEEVKNGSES
jgi:large subunit ribosomal protein L22